VGCQVQDAVHSRYLRRHDTKTHLGKFASRPGKVFVQVLVSHSKRVTILILICVKASDGAKAPSVIIPLHDMRQHRFPALPICVPCCRYSWDIMHILSIFCHLLIFSQDLSFLRSKHFQKVHISMPVLYHSKLRPDPSSSKETVDHSLLLDSVLPVLQSHMPRHLHHTGTLLSAWLSHGGCRVVAVAWRADN